MTEKKNEETFPFFFKKINILEIRGSFLLISLFDLAGSLRQLESSLTFAGEWYILLNDELYTEAKYMFYILLLEKLLYFSNFLFVFLVIFFLFYLIISLIIPLCIHCERIFIDVLIWYVIIVLIIVLCSCKNDDSIWRYLLRNWVDLGTIKFHNLFV